MIFNSWLQNARLVSPSRRSRRNGRRALSSRAAARSRPRLELLEDRTLLSAVSFSPPATYPVGQGPIPVAVGDFNGDGVPDLATSNSVTQNVSLLLGNGDGTFQTAQNFDTGSGGDDFAIAAGDFNGDGKLDLAVANDFRGAGTGNVSVLMGNGNGTFQTAQNFATGGIGSVSVVVRDFNRDGKPDLAVASESSASVGVLLGNGDGTFQTAHNFNVGGSPASLAVGDFNGDGELDLVTANVFSGTVSVLPGNGDGTFQTAQVLAAGGEPISVAVGDFNGDGKFDLAVANQFVGITGQIGNVSVLFGNGNGSFQSPQSFAAGAEPASVVVGDFNGDGKPDLALVSASQPSVDVVLGNGDGTFQTAQTFPMDSSDSLAVGDFNGDGKPDLAATNGSSAGGSVTVLMNQLVTTTAVSGPTSSTYAQSVTYTASVTSGGKPATGGAITFLDGNTAVSPALAVNANGQASFRIATLNAGSHTISAAYSGSPAGAGTTGFGASVGNTSLTINQAPLSATGVNSHATAGAPFTGTIATFTNPDPYGSAASYSAIITWSDGSTSNGTITGSGTLTVQGSHTYDDPGTDAVSVQISHILGNTTTATVLATATVVTLGQSVQSGLTGNIGFWHSKTGQALINSFNGGSTATALSGWLAGAFPNLYGANAGNNDLAGQFNSQVVAFFKSQAALPGSNVEAQVLATALNAYATTLSLGGTIGQAYGFNVSADGLGADSFNVGADSAAFGVAKKTTLNVYELLKAVDRQAVLGVLYNGDPTLQKLANHLFHLLNDTGSIS
jgi:hypothetical protein